jgi:serine protease Do
MKARYFGISVILLALVSMTHWSSFDLAHLSDSATAAPQADLWTEKSTLKQSDKSIAAQADALNKTFISLAETLSPTVVNIYTTTRVSRGMGPNGSPDDLFRFFFGNPFGPPGGGGGLPPQQDAQALGSGFLINTEGFIVTNSHVVRQNRKNADQILVKFRGDKTKGSEAEVVGVDDRTDVAVLRLKKKLPGLIQAPLGNSDDVKVGEWVVAIGNPYGHSHTVTQGIVSALGRALDPTTTEFIQTDASINPGNSGGPLFNIQGQVIGINTAIDARAQGIGFAIPINTAKRVIRDLVEKGEVTRGWIGVTISPLTPEIAESLGIPEAKGVMIQDVIPGEPADKAGLKSYDVVESVNGKEIPGPREFMAQVADQPVGATINMNIIRDGKKKSFTVKVAKRLPDDQLAQRPIPEDKGVEVPAGMRLGELTGNQKKMMGVESGVLVIGVHPEGLAYNAGIAPGDVLLEINRKPIRNIADAKKELGQKSRAFLVKLQRENATIILLVSRGEE